MEYIARLLSTCSSVQKAGAFDVNSEDSSEIQLNAFEFRNYRTNLETSQQKLVERLVNQWCAMLVKGKRLSVNGFPQKITMDKDMLGLQRQHEYYPLKEMCRMDMFKDPEEMMVERPYCVEMTFRLVVTLDEPQRVVHGERAFRVNFEQENQRLNFALTLRILRTRDPTLDTSTGLKVLAKDEEDEEEEPTIGRLVGCYHYNIDTGIPIVFSVSDLKLCKQLQSSSRLVYIEFFARYPRQDKFLYAKSPTAPIPQKALLTEDAALRRKKEKQEGVEEDDQRRSDGKKQSIAAEQYIESMAFDFKNVKLKIPKVPHTIFGRLMAKDDYFPTAIGTFDFEVTRKCLQDRRRGYRDDEDRKEPEVLSIPMMSTWRMAVKGRQEDFAKIGVLTIRLLGYVYDAVQAEGTQAREEDAGEGDEEEEEDFEEDDEGEDGDEYSDGEAG